MSSKFYPSFIPIYVYMVSGVRREARKRGNPEPEPLYETPPNRNSEQIQRSMFDVYFLVNTYETLHLDRIIRIYFAWYGYILSIQLILSEK